MISPKEWVGEWGVNVDIPFPHSRENSQTMDSLRSYNVTRAISLFSEGVLCNTWDNTCKSKQKSNNNLSSFKAATTKIYFLCERCFGNFMCSWSLLPRNSFCTSDRVACPLTTLHRSAYFSLSTGASFPCHFYDHSCFESQYMIEVCQVSLQGNF